MSFNDDDKEKLTNTEDKENKEILNQDDEFEYVEVDENSDLDDDYEYVEVDEDSELEDGYEYVEVDEDGNEISQGTSETTPAPAEEELSEAAQKINDDLNAPQLANIQLEYA